MSQKANVVIYHRADFDGIFCREIARKFLGDTAEYIGWDYNDDKLPFPDNVPNVYVLDLSPECFDDVTVPQGAQLIWIDHHKSAIEKWPDNLAGYRIDGVAACRLAWQWFLLHEAWDPREQHPPGDLPAKQDFVDRKVSEPRAVRLAGEYDIWDKRDPRAELFQHGLRSRELGDFDWRQILSTQIPSMEEIEKLASVGMQNFLEPDGTMLPSVVIGLLENGYVLQWNRTRENESVIKELGFTLDWEGLKFLACNAARSNSLLFTAGLQPEHDACFGFKWTGRDWAISLYHAPGKEHLDLSLIAQSYGGGGHRGACGFRLKTLPFPNS